MKASLKLMVSEKETSSGYPIYLFLRCSGKPDKKKVVGHSSIKDWDAKNSVVYETHPDYSAIMPLLLEYKSNILNVNFGKFDYSGAVDLLFGDIGIVGMSFYKMALMKCSGLPSESINTTVLNSFNAFYPDVLIDDITADHAKKYMEHIMKHQKPNGAHTYMRKLNALYGILSDKPNPFKGLRPKKERTPNKSLDDVDLKKIFYTRNFKEKGVADYSILSLNSYRYYYMLLFYLGGIDLVDLANLRYDKHVFNDRIRFTRFKGGTDAIVNNKIFPKAKHILEKFDCYPYLVPIYQQGNYQSFRSNMNKRFYKKLSDLNIKVKPLTKSARYSFINRAQQLLIDERITMELVGHTKKSVHSIYTNEFPLSVRDEAHERIIDI